ncbi:MAG: hypothetical protein ACON4K_08435 [Akkermansiaceae bacterium]
MSDHDENRDDQKIPEGMVKKVRRVKGKRRSKQSKEKGSPSLIEQGKGLLEAMQHDSEESGPVDLQEQIRRLKAEGEESALDDVWGSKKKSTSWIWMSLVGLVIPVVGIAIGMAMLDGKKESPDKGLQLPGFKPFQSEEVSLEEEPHAWFYERENERDFLREAREILRKINEATNPSEITQFLRPSSFREKNPVDLDTWGPPVIVNGSVNSPWTLPTVVAEGDSEENARGVLALNLKREDQEKVSAFFVFEEGKLLLDWDATTGWGEVSWSELRSTKPREAKILRARVVKKASYDALLGEVIQSGYLLSNDDGSQFIFAFIPLDSDENRANDKALKDLLNYGQLSTVLKGNLRVTVRVRFGNEKGRGGRFEIVDYLHEGWVKP